MAFDRDNCDLDPESVSRVVNTDLHNQEWFPRLNLGNHIRPYEWNTLDIVAYHNPADQRLYGSFYTNCRLNQTKGFDYDTLRPFNWAQYMVGITGFGTHGIEQWFDDIYLDREVARVEICDHYRYDSITKKDICPSTQWGNGQCQVAAKPHSFNPGDPAYIFVWNNGVLCNTSGYEVTIG